VTGGSVPETVGGGEAEVVETVGGE
jgi:hypothetical protein